MNQTKAQLDDLPRDYLVAVVYDLTSKLKKKNEQIAAVRSKLSKIRSRGVKMRELIIRQRKRILELYHRQS
jgi:hypothetical protein